MTTMEEADELREWALTTAAATPAAAATPEQLARHLEFLHAALPSRANDMETGKRRFAVYASLLTGKSNEALAYMARRAAETLEWFPSPSQCLEILKGYHPPDTPQAAALIEVQRFTDAQFPAWLKAVRGGGPIGNPPEQWMRIAVEQGVMRRLADGSMVSRALYHGPPRQPYRPPPRPDPVAISDTPPTTLDGPAGASVEIVP
ncbi:hypothetical protein ACWGNZ_00860 [Sphingomonas zeae]